MFMEDVKKSMEAGLMCTIDGDTFFHKEYMDWRLWCVVSHHEGQYWSIQCHQHQ